MTYEWRNAHISECGNYRYSLVRTWDRTLATMVFVMLNPSTADASVDDNTVRKCVGIARRHGCGSIEVVNLWPYRATDPKQMHAHMRARDPHDVSDRANDVSIRLACRRAKESGGVVVCAWGAHGRRYPRRVADVMEILDHADVPLRCLRRLKDGTPQHPLMVPYAAGLQPFPVEEFV